MLGTLYRYPHPFEKGRFLYCGQGEQRDKAHRSGRSHFGRRFKKTFPNVELPYPIREQIEVKNDQELNEVETIWMFQYHTWRGYSGGMNLTLPGSIDYRNMAAMGGRIGGLIAGRIARESGQIARLGYAQGQKNNENGWLASLRTKEHQSKAGRISGQKNVESGWIQKLGQKNVESGHLQTFWKSGIGGRVGGPIGGRKGMHIRWHIRRGIKKQGCQFCDELIK